MTIRLEDATTLARSNIRSALATFGSVRRPTLIKLADMQNNTKLTSEQLVNMESGISPHCRVKSPFGHLIKNSAYEQTDFAGANAFEAYVALLKEREQAGEEFEGVLVSKARYPYNFVATVGDTTNLILVYDSSGARRLMHHNRAAELREGETLIFVIPPGYKQEDIGKIKITGKYRVALLRAPKPNKAFCALSDTFEGK